MSKDKNEEIDTFFANDLKNIATGETPNASEWATLSNRLEAEKKRKRVFVPYFLILCGFLMLGSAILFSKDKMIEKNNLNSQSDIQQIKKDFPPTDFPQKTKSFESNYNIEPNKNTKYNSNISTKSEPNKTTKYDSNLSAKSEPNKTTKYDSNLSAKSEPNKNTKYEPNLSTKSEPNKNTKYEPNLSAKSEPNKNTKYDPNFASENENSIVFSQLIMGAKNTELIAMAENSQLSKPSQGFNKTEEFQGFLKTKNIALAQSINVTPNVHQKLTFDTTLWINTLVEKVNTPKKSIRFGVGIGTFINARTLNGFKLSNPIAASIHSELILNRHWSIVGGLNFATFHFDINGQIDKRLLVDAPFPQDANFRFKYFEGNVTQINPSIALRYYFMPEKTLKWYVGIGNTSRIILPSIATCTYLEIDHGVEEDYVYKIPINVPNRLKMAFGQVGFQYQVRPKINLFGEFGAELFDWGLGQKTYSNLSSQFGLAWQLR
jgi:hypothetical protein